MSKLSEYRESVKRRDFSSISEERQREMSKIVDNLAENRELQRIVISDCIRTIKELVPDINLSDMDIGIAMIQSCICDVLDFLIENGSLKVEDLLKGAKK